MKLKLFLIALLGALLYPAFVLAQNPTPAVEVDPTVMALLLSVTGALIAFGSTVGTGFVKKHVTDIPRYLVPIVSAAIGVAVDFGMSYTPGGKFAPVIAIAVVGLVNFGRSILSNLVSNPNAVADKTILVLLIGVGLVSQGCASTQLAKKDGTVALTAARSALNLIEVTLLKTECGKAEAPPAPACVPPDAADKAYTLISKAADVGNQASVTLRKLPSSLDGNTTYSAIEPFLGQIWDIITKIRGLFPSSNAAEKLESDLSKLKR